MDDRFGKLITEYRNRLNWNEAKLASKAKLTCSTISRIESGDTHSLHTAQKILSALHNNHPFTRAELRRLAVDYLIPEDLERTDETELIGLCVPSVLRTSFWNKVVAAIEHQAQEQGKAIVLVTHDESIDRELKYLDLFTDPSLICGLILAPAAGSSIATVRESRVPLRTRLAKLAAANIPIVLIDRKPWSKEHADQLVPQDVLPHVGVDNRRAARLAVDYLITKFEHAKIGALMSLRHTSTQWDRYEGFRDALKAHGLYHEQLHNPYGTWVKWGHNVAVVDTERLGYRRGRANTEDLLRDPDNRPTALFCATHYMATSALEAIKKNGLSVPGDISVISFDDVPELEGIARVQYSIDELARTAVAKIMDLLDDPGNPDARTSVHIDTLPVINPGSVGPSLHRDLPPLSRLGNPPGP